MSKQRIIVEFDDEAITDTDAIAYVLRVVSKGKCSCLGGRACYCIATVYEPSNVVVYNRFRGSRPNTNSFKVYREKLA